MTLPMFPPGQGPGPDFSELLRRLGLGPFSVRAPSDGGSARAGAHGTPAGGGPLGVASTGQLLEVRHGTTICALRYADGVIMAGDRRATAGSSIAHRMMEKVHPADSHSGVAFAGAAGQAMEMVRLFQLQLEHYEKVEGQALTLEGKANQLSQMVRSNLAMALQGFVVVPLFAGYDLRQGRGRIYTYDFTGGRYEETDYHADGSGGRDARTTIKLGFREDLTRAEGIELCVRALWEAADEDSATGGPDAVRGIYPTVATITSGGFEPVPETEVAAAFDKVISTLGSAERGPRASAGGGGSGTEGGGPATGRRGRSGTGGTSSGVARKTAGTVGREGHDAGSDRR